MPKRFAYEPAESVLDSFAQGPRTTQFRRSYRKFKFMVAGYAYCDFDRGERPNATALSYAWEDAQMAFTGHGEPALIGCILQMWVHLLPKEKDLFQRAIERAFKKAEQATPEDTARRYMSRWRNKPVRRPEQGFNLNTILPAAGVKLRDWAVDSGEDPDVVSEQFHWLEQADRQEQAEKKQGSKRQAASANSPTRAKGFLRLVTEESEDD